MAGAPRLNEAPDAERPTGRDQSKAGESLSAFLAKVMDQLSVTAWLPAVVLVGNAALLLALSAQENLDFSTAIGDLAAMEWGAVVVGIFAVTIAAVFLQAFEFEILRFFEGYHRSNAMRRRAVHRIDKRVAERRALARRVSMLETAAFEAARISALGASGVTEDDRAAWDALEKVVRGWELTEANRMHLSRASALDWPSHCPAGLLHDWDVAQLQLAEYPADHRVLPTRLGNAMRAAEDEVELAEDEDLEGFIIRNYDRLPATISEEHDAYRNRLEMYLALIVASAALTALSIGCLWHSAGSIASIVARIVIPFVYLAAGFLCYRAAIASALGFGVALREAGAWVNSQGRIKPEMVP